MDQELKQRLIGASVIIALAIIFVPMLFDGEVDQKNNQNISINIPDPGENNLEVKKFELDKPVVEVKDLPPGDTELVIQDEEPMLVAKDQANPVTEPPATNTTQDSTQPTAADTADIESPAEQTQPMETKPLVQQSVEPPEQRPEQRPEQKPEQRPEPQPAVTQPAPVTASTEAVYRVKLGSFSQQGNAERVKSSLLQNNIQAVVEYNTELKLYRVWSQELYQDQAKANGYVQAVERMNLNIGTPKVITLKAEEIAQMASQGQMGWVVQLGSFSAKNNAIELRNKVKAAGFDGFVDVISNSRGQRLYRLRIGPLMERGDAEQTQRQIKQKLKLDGLIKNHELSQIVN